MNVAFVHNFYRQAGGEDRVFALESSLLESKGHTVVRYEARNLDIEGNAGLKEAAGAIWNHASYRRIRQLLRANRIDVLHLHNTFPLISPAVYYAARAEGAAVVQTLHNYRLLCPGATLFRDGRPCEQCVGRVVPLPGIVHGCYRENRAATAVVASMLLTHNLLRTWHRTVDRYIALTSFARDKFIQGGLPAAKLVVKPNFLYPDPGVGDGAGNYALFLGRLSPEKGIAALLQAWNTLAGKVPLRVAGDGPMVEMVRNASARLPGIEYLGKLSAERTAAEIRDASVVIVPSIWYEGLPMTVIEAFAAGTPVVAGDIGTLRELIADYETGLHFKPGDPADLAEKVGWLFENPVLLRTMRKGAREVFKRNYTGERNYEMLMEIYAESLASRRVAPPRKLHYVT